MLGSLNTKVRRTIYNSIVAFPTLNIGSINIWIKQLTF